MDSVNHEGQQCMPRATPPTACSWASSSISTRPTTRVRSVAVRWGDLWRTAGRAPGSFCCPGRGHLLISAPAQAQIGRQLVPGLPIRSNHDRSAIGALKWPAPACVVARPATTTTGGPAASEACWGAEAGEGRTPPSSGRLHRFDTRTAFVDVAFAYDPESRPSKR